MENLTTLAVEVAASLLLGRDNLEAEFEDGTWMVHDPNTGACWEVETDGKHITGFKCIGEGMND